MREALVSVIIPAYNAAKYIEETINSAIQSSYSSIEIIVVNDGSTDNTREVVLTIREKYSELIKYIEQSNSGVAAARNLAIRCANGKYILPLDADDLIDKDYIKKGVDVLANSPEVKVVYGGAYYFGAKKGIWKLPTFSMSLLARRNIIYVSGIYRKEDFLQTDGYCVEIAGMEDWDFWISMLKTGGEVIFLPDTCFYYRILPDSKRKNDAKKNKQIIDTLNIRHKEFFEKQLGGKLHYNRSWSKLLNKVSLMFSK